MSASQSIGSKIGIGFGTYSGCDKRHQVRFFVDGPDDKCHSLHLHSVHGCGEVSAGNTCGT